MGIVKTTYINLEDEIVERVYYRLPYSQRNRRPKCELFGCGNTLVKLYAQNNGKRLNIGLYCAYCDAVFVEKKHKIFGMVLPE